MSARTVQQRAARDMCQEGGETVGRALLQTDVVGDFRQGAFALLLEPGVRHCGFLCRGSAATVMEALGESDA